MSKASRFLKTATAREAANRTGYSSIEDFQPDDSPNLIGISMSGHYTVDEMRAKLVDLEFVQAAFDKWCVSAPVAQVDGDDFLERNAGRLCAIAFGAE